MTTCMCCGKRRKDGSAAFNDDLRACKDRVLCTVRALGPTRGKTAAKRMRRVTG